MLPFVISEFKQQLSATPGVLKTWLSGLPESWLHANEGPETFSPFDVVGHLIHGEQADWLARTRVILEYGESRPFDPYDRFAQYEISKGKSIQELLDQFGILRRKNLEALEQMDLQEENLNKTGLHPGLGQVTLRQLLAAWVVHDLGHIAQISRVMAKQYTAEVGPWIQYLSVLHDRI